MKRSWVWLTVGILLLVMITVGFLYLKKPVKPTEKELLVFAAASMSDALKEATEVFLAANPGVKIDFSWGSSGALQIQIEQGAPADLFISAGQKQVNALLKQEFLLPESVRTVVNNQLVIVGQKATALTITELQDLQNEVIQRIGIGDPAVVPAGQYASEALTNAEVVEAIQDKLIYGNDVRQVLQYVESGEVDLGFVYLTDAKVAKEVEVLYTVPAELHKPIVYPAGVVKSSQNQELAQKYLDFLFSTQGQEVFEKYGFETK